MGFSLLAMLMPVLMMVGIGAVAIGIYRKLSGPREGGEAGAFQEKLLFEIDRLQVQMQIANERLERLETRYLGTSRGGALPRGDDDESLT